MYNCVHCTQVNKNVWQKVLQTSQKVRIQASQVVSMYDWTKDDRGWFKGNFAENFAVDVAKLSYPDAPEYDPSDYESMRYWSQVKGVSSYANSHMVELEQAELGRWKNDFKKYTGADYNPTYPIRAGAYARQYAFSPSEGLMDMYTNLAMLRKW